jgi:hypothetical protein
MNDAAQRALTGSQFEARPHLCQKWVRQVIQSLYSDTFDQLFETDAIRTGNCFNAHGLGVPLLHGSAVGDVLYKLHGSGGHGHVGIRIEGNRVAENSSVHWDGHEARGIRSLREFGNFDLIIRLPLPDSAELARWILNFSDERKTGLHGAYGRD